MALVAGTVAILTGVTVLTRSFTLTIVQEYLFIVSLDVVVLLNGLLHLFGGFRTQQQRGFLLIGDALALRRMRMQQRQLVH